MTRDIYERRVGEVMSRDVVTINARDSVHDALQMMTENKVAALPVVDWQGSWVGIISTSDLIHVTRDLESGLDELENTDELLWGHVIEKIGDGLGHQSVTDLMSEDVVMTTPDTRLAEAASAMLRQRVHRLPVVDPSGRLVGIISTTDVLAAFVDGATVKTVKPQYS